MSTDYHTILTSFNVHAIQKYIIKRSSLTLCGLIEKILMFNCIECNIVFRCMRMFRCTDTSLRIIHHTKRKTQNFGRTMAVKVFSKISVG